MINAELSIERQNIKEDKISGDYKTTVKLTSGGSVINILINTNLKYDKNANIPSVDLSGTKSFDEISDSELENIYSKLYPILEPIMGGIDEDESTFWRRFFVATKKEEHYILPIPILSRTSFNFLDATSFVLDKPSSNTSLIKLLLIISLYLVWIVVSKLHTSSATAFLNVP